MKSRNNNWMRSMARSMVILIGLCWAVNASAQQLPISDMYTINPHWVNPAAVGTSTMNQLMLSYQQRKLDWGNVRSMSQFLNYQSGPQGRNRNFGWGLFVNNDLEHTENRISLNGAIAVQLVRNQFNQLSVGINGGILNWGSGYGRNRVYDRSDELLALPTNFAELDAGLGIRYAYNNYFIRAEGNAAITQLPGNLVSKFNTGVRLDPHMLAGGNALFTFDNNLYMGPMAFYRNTFGQKDTVLHTGTVDLGAKMEVLRWGFWAGGAYRINQAAILAGFGLKVINPDTLFESSRTAYFLGINATATYPLNQSRTFGPSVELGIVLQFGRVGEIAARQDTLQQIRGAFWKNDGNINTHKVAHLIANSPPNLRARTNPEEKIVMLTYGWDDNIYAYVGEHPEYAYDTLLSAVGQEWVGIDGVLTNMVTEVIKEALYPDTINALFPDSIERLRNLSSIELNGYLKVDELAADFGAQGAIYAGDLKGKAGSDTLRIRVRYADRDTTVIVYKGQNLSNLQLACLKLHSMRKKLEYEFNKYYGRDMALFWDGETINDEKMKGRKPVFFKIPTLTPNNPNQKPFMVGQVRLNFTRIPNYFEQRDMATNGKGGKGKGKGGKGKGKNKPQPVKGRDAFRDPVGVQK
jgi:hypothetical protein